MIDLGRPATRDEIAKQAEFPEEPPARLSALLSGLPSVGRAGKDTWALLDRIDDVYEGIPTEITQRIHEDGGATTLSRLLEELPRKFGVSESSVRTYVATPQFTLRDGFVSVADESTLKYRDFEDVIDGRTDSGDPFREFTVESRFFEGYSVLGFPPELACHLGCEPNGSIRVNISAPEQCRPISVIWRLASSTGASVGYLMDPLQALGVDSGSQVRLVFVSGSTVRFEAGRPSNPCHHQRNCGWRSPRTTQATPAGAVTCYLRTNPPAGPLQTPRGTRWPAPAHPRVPGRYVGAARAFGWFTAGWTQSTRSGPGRRPCTPRHGPDRVHGLSGVVRGGADRHRGRVHDVRGRGCTAHC